MDKKKLTDKYEVGLMIAGVAVILVIAGILTLNPEKGVEIGNGLMYFLTHVFGTPTQIFALAVFVGLIVLALSKYGNIRMGAEKPEYRTLSWIGMMFFCGNGAGTVYWAFLEWGYHFNAAPQLHGAPITEAYAYEQAIAYTFYDWGPIAWALLCVFTLPFAYHYFIKHDSNLKLSATTKYAVGEKHANGAFGKVVDFLFIFAAIGSVAITAGTSATTIGAVISELFHIDNSFALSVWILLGVAVYYL